ncbi:MAG: SRPBCC family protein [Terracidiphilus sp.]|jgi:activator of HSP90 ATPase
MSTSSMPIGPASPILNRRGILAGIAALTTTQLTHSSYLGAQQPTMEQKPSTSAHALLTALHYEIDFKASPERLYEALIDQKQFAAFTGMPATIDRTPGGAFSLFGGLIEGRNIELVPNLRIVQAWRPADWPAGLYTLVRFELKPRGTEATLICDHTSFPAGGYDHLDSGWYTHYWDPLKKYLA